MKNEAIIGGIVVGGQPDAADVASGRFTTIINCRPPDEEGNVTGEAAKLDAHQPPGSGWLQQALPQTWGKWYFDAARCWSSSLPSLR